MFYVLYDKDFQAIGTERATYPVSSWKIVSKAFEFDEISITGMKIKNADKAVFVAMFTNQGSLKKVALSGVPITKSGITSLNGLDVRQVLNTKAYIDFLTSAFIDIRDLYKYLIRLALDYDTSSSTAYTTTLTGGAPFSSVVIDFTELVANNMLDIAEGLVDDTIAVGNVWDTIQSICAVQGQYLDAAVDVRTGALTLTVRPYVYEISIKLDDFDEPKQISDKSATNQALCIDTRLGTKVRYYRTRSDVVTLTPDADDIIYPIRTKVFVEGGLAAAKTAGIQELYKNRYQRNVEIDLNSRMGYLLKDVGLNYMINIYGFNSDDYTVFTTLPVMSLTEDSSGNKKIAIGRLEEYWWLQ